jgi:hypothetical protein
VGPGGGVAHDWNGAGSSAPGRGTGHSARLPVPRCGGKNTKNKRHRARLCRSVPVAYAGADSLKPCLPAAASIVVRGARALSRASVRLPVVAPYNASR